MSNEIIKIDKAKFLETFTPQNIRTHLSRVKSCSEAIKIDKNGVSFYRKHIGQTEIETIIGALITNFQKSINVNKELTGFQIDELVNEIINSYYFLSIIEIAFIFKQAKTGKYKVNTFALSMPDVIQWFEKYSEERIKEFQKIQEQENRQRKAGKEIVFDEQTGKSKVYDQQSTLTEKSLLKVFQDVKKELKPKFNKEEYQRIKSSQNEIELIDQSENEELNKLKEILNIKYGIDDK